MRYVADDGITFDTEQECLEHESLIADIESSFIMYDEDLNKLSSEEDYVGCYYVHVLRRAADVGDYLYSQYGIGVEPTDIAKEGIYYYDNDGRFRSVDALFYYHCEQAEKFRKIKEKLLVLSGKEDL